MTPQVVRNANSVAAYLSSLLEVQDMGRSSYQQPKVRKRVSNGKTKLARPYWFCRVKEWVRGPEGLRRKHSEKRLGYCDEVSLEDAKVKRDKLLAPINRLSEPIADEVTFEEFVALYYKPQHVAQLAASTRAKYNQHLDHHLVPELGSKKLKDISTRRLQLYFQAKLSELSWFARADLKNILSSVFRKAAIWSMHQGDNPAKNIDIGRQRAKREKVILSPDQLKLLLAILPPDIALLCEALDVTGCRVSELLGLQEKHLSADCDWASIKQRWWRGDLDEPKSERAVRDVPLGDLAERFKERLTGDPQQFIFDKGDGLPWDDRDLLREVVRPALKASKLYREGLGFHSLRRKAITELQAKGASSIEAAKFAGHSKTSMTEGYTVLERKRMEELTRARRGGEEKPAVQ